MSWFSKRLRWRVAGRFFLSSAVVLAVAPAALGAPPTASAEVSAHELVVEVADAQGRPVAGARVSVREPDGHVVASATSDATGRVTLDSNGSGVELRVERTGFLEATRRLETDTGEIRVTLDLAPVEGRVVVRAALPELAQETSLDAADLADRASRDVAQALRSAPGLDAVRRGPVNLDPVVRGLAETQVAAFVDGTVTLAAGPARMDSGLSHVAPHGVSEVQVVKGPYALSWGSGALSAIDVQLTEPGFASAGTRWTGKVSTDGRNNGGGEDAFASVAGSGERVYGQLLGEHRAGDDYDSGDGTRVPGDYESLDLHWSLGFKASDSWTVEGSGGYQAQDDIDYPGQILDATYFRTRSVQLRSVFRPSRGADEVFAQVYSNRKDHRMNNDEKPTAQPMAGRIPPFGIRVDLPTESNTAGGRLYAVFDRGDWTWRTGGDAYRARQNAIRRIYRRDTDQLVFEDRIWPDAELTSAGVYGQGVWRHDRWQVGGTLRLDNAESQAGEVSDFFRSATGVPPGGLSRDDDTWSAAVSTTVRVGDGWLLHAGVGRAVRTPTILERYSDRIPSSRFQVSAEFVGNPSLDPETSLEWDLGAQGSSGRTSVSLDLFYRSLGDNVTVLPDPSLPRRLPLSPPLAYRYVNGDGAIYYGGEFRLSQEVGRRFSWWTNAEYTHGEDRTFDEPAFGVPPLAVDAGIRVAAPRGRWWTSLAARWVADQDRVATARLELPTEGYTTFDLRGAVEINPRVTVRGGVENLTDEEYTTHLNARNPFTGARIPEPGRRIYGGFELTF
ncbi:MAG: TonB-dependent receptor [Acidobacteria bacterium]|nr:TonB-dependent receptor [Acidobacteriota bacterium]